MLTGLDYGRSSDVWSPVVVAGENNNNDPLLGRSVRHWCWPFGLTDGEYARLVKGSGLEDDAINSPEGQTKLQSELDEGLRLLYVGFTRAQTKIVLAHRANKYSWLAQLTNIDTLLPPALQEGEHAVDGIDTTLVVRELNPQEADACRCPRSANETWFAPAMSQPTADIVERYHRPSAVIAPTNDATFEIVDISETPYFPSGADESNYAAIGDAVHAYFAGLPSLPSATQDLKLSVARRCIEGYGASAYLTPDVLVAKGESFRSWINLHYPGATWHTEVPVSAPRLAGGQWVGTIDLIIETPDGKIAIIDHKSAPLRREHCQQKAATFNGQLLAYREILSTSGITVSSLYIHFPLAGVACRLQLRDS